MSRILAIALAVTCGTIGVACAQQPPERIYTLKLNARIVEAIWEAIQEAPLPRKKTDAAVAEIDRQVRAQNAEWLAQEKAKAEEQK